MNPEQYHASKAGILKLKVENFTASHVVMVLNLAMLAGALGLYFADSLLANAAGVALWSLQLIHAYLIVHETAHGSFLKKNRANEYVGNFFAFLALLPFYSRRLEHLTHHRMAGTFDEPSTKRAVERFRFINPRAERIMSVCWKLWVPIFALNEQIMLWTLPFKPGTKGRIRKSAQVALALYALLFVICTLLSASHNPLWVFAQFFMIFYCYMMLVEYFNLPHHLSSPFEDRKGNVPYHEQDYYSHSCAPMPRPFGPWLNLNFNYHVAHHLYPAVHWSKLGEAHAIMAAADPATGDISENELTQNINMRRKPLREALSKFYDYQHSRAAV